MTTLVLTSPAEVTAAVGAVVTVTVTVSDDTVPVFRSSDGYKLSAKKSDITGAWSAQWVTLKAGTYAITVNAGDATPVSASVVVGGGGGGPEPDPEVVLSDEAVAVLLNLTDSATRAAARTLVAADVANPATAIGGALSATIAVRSSRQTTLVLAAADSVDKAGADIICNGADDQEAIDEARDYLDAGGTIAFRQGSYLLSDFHDVNKSHITYAGENHPFWNGFLGSYIHGSNPPTTVGTEGTGSAKLKSTVSGLGIFRLSNGAALDGREKGIAFRRLYLYGFNHTGTAISQAGGLHDLMLFEDLMIHNFQDGINVGLDAATFTRVSVQDCARHAIKVAGVYATLDKCVIADCGGYGLWMLGYQGEATNMTLVNLHLGAFLEGVGNSLVGGKIKSPAVAAVVDGGKGNSVIGVAINLDANPGRAAVTDAGVILSNSNNGGAIVQGNQFIAPDTVGTLAIPAVLIKDTGTSATHNLVALNNIKPGKFNNGNARTIGWPSSKGHLVKDNIGDTAAGYDPANVTDDFNRADSTNTLGQTPAGLGWSTNPGFGWGITSNKAAAPGVGANQSNADMDTGTTDVTVTATVAGTSSANQGFVLRATNYLNGYLVVFNDAGLTKVYKNVAGATTQVGGNGGAAPVTGDVMSASIVGNVITVKKNGVTSLTVTDATNTWLTQTRHGLWVFGPATAAARAYDNFSLTSP